MDSHSLKTALVVLAISSLPSVAAAQVTPAAGYTPPDDTPSVRVGLTLFPVYTYQTDPKITDANGNTVNKNSFDVARAYINITGNISHIVAFRLTPDVTRESGLLTLATGNSVPNDSLVYRIKYAYAQFNLDDWMTRGSWVRIGIQQTPWVDFEEGIYRYRFQGTVFAERIPLPTTMTSSDAGASFHYNFPSNFGEVHLGVYNGENYQRVEVNNQKAIEFRGTVRPFATSLPVLRGLRAHLVYYNDHYVRGNERMRLMGNLTFEHQYLNAGFDYLKAKDQAQATANDIASNGYSVWATPRAPMANGSSWEALLRYDHWKPNTASTPAPASSSPIPGTTLLNSQAQNRAIFGVSYWFPHQGNVTTAILVDYDGQQFKNITTAPSAAPPKIISVHGLINF
ncbi:MAG TPA: porin [Vicinamibacterales bacterium]|nr:porin [Vicinamibacterales bacterium]